MTIWVRILDALDRHQTCALVTVVATRGSAPRDAGAQLVVTPEGYHGTIGGGALEWRAIAAAQAMLNGCASSKRSSHALGPELGQCCGGHVELLTEVFDKSSVDRIKARAADHREELRKVFLFGAGHVGRSLVLALAPLPFEIVWVDPRPSAFPTVMPSKVTAVAADNPPSVLLGASAGSLAFVMTHSHALDLAIADAALREQGIAHVGLIGSVTKRARFERRLQAAGIPEERMSALICPIGVPGIRSKEPQMIALAAAAQIGILHEALTEGRATDTASETRRRA
ncbi:MAG: xanthine dehydrogenase accessory protein XdhC [Alphaproteobacteria bacterium]|nr:xanthine dehydrogenase accessory protein XdhC [Alphaproteobacteria bacterium]